LIAAAAAAAAATTTTTTALAYNLLIFSTINIPTDLAVDIVQLYVSILTTVDRI
jgi:hypothetical protein